MKLYVNSPTSDLRNKLENRGYSVMDSSTARTIKDGFDLMREADQVIFVLTEQFCDYHKLGFALGSGKSIVIVMLEEPTDYPFIDQSKITTVASLNELLTILPEVETPECTGGEVWQLDTN